MDGLCGQSQLVGPVWPCSTGSRPRMRIVHKPTRPLLTTFSIHIRFIMSIRVCPSAVLVLCGKRKSGKDYIADQLRQLLDDQVSTLRLSKPLKAQYAKDHGLDLERLMDSSAYKETYRKDMIVWGEEMRAKDPGYFCRLATQEADKPVWLVCDARRKTDMDYFKSYYGVCTITVRVVASDAVRVGRGWVFTAGVDDAESECGLDDYNCDVIITNNGDDTIYSANNEPDAINSNSEMAGVKGTSLREQLETVLKMVKDRLQK